MISRVFFNRVRSLRPLIQNRHYSNEAPVNDKTVIDDADFKMEFLGQENSGILFYRLLYPIFVFNQIYSGIESITLIKAKCFFFELFRVCVSLPFHAML